jgi:hypothetical protein
MKAAVVSVPLRDGLLKKPDWLDHQTAVGLTFAIKTFAASLRRTTPTGLPRAENLCGVRREICSSGPVLALAITMIASASPNSAYAADNHKLSTYDRAATRTCSIRGDRILPEHDSST